MISTEHLYPVCHYRTDWYTLLNLNSLKLYLLFYIFWNDWKRIEYHLCFFSWNICFMTICILFQIFINLCLKPISMVWMKIKISFGISRKGRNSSLPNTVVLHTQTHRFPRLHLWVGSMDSSKLYGILSPCFCVLICPTINDILPSIIILSKF